jgi:hypothetical protein
MVGRSGSLDLLVGILLGISIGVELVGRSAMLTERGAGSWELEGE